MPDVASLSHWPPYGESTRPRPPSSLWPLPRMSYTLLLLVVFLLTSPLHTTASDTGDSEENVYNYFFNDHSSIATNGIGSSSSSSSSSNSGSNGFTTDGSDVDPYRHTGDYNLDLGEDWTKMGSRIRKPKCVDIPENMTLCHDIGYKSMMLPNILEHDTLAEVTNQARSWIPLININCHPDTKVFLCSLFSPICLDRLIYPCRSLCEAVHANCEYRMKTYGFDWPEMLECKKFPLENDMCIKPIHNFVADNNCTACRHPLTYESLIDHFCRADIVLKATLKTFKDVLGDRQLVLRKKKKIYKSKDTSNRDARKLVPIIEGGASCVCETINATQERYLLMGKKKGDKMVITFGIPWKKKNKEFRRGIRAIRKSSTCEGIFNELSRNGIDKHAGSNGGKTTPVKKGKGKRRGRKKGRKGKKGKKRKGKGKGKGKKGRKGRKKKRKNKKGGRKGGKKNKASNQANRGKTSQEEKWTREDQALSNFMKAAN